MGVTSRRDTIAAIATAPGSGGVAIIRVSGSEAHAIAGRVFRRRHGHGFPEARRVYLGQLLDRPGGEVLDEVLAFGMLGPHTYTGEDVVEVQCHGGSLISQRVLESVCMAGARPAEPGEFTKRAFLNGRLDLAQAEAVADLIMARSEAGRRLAWSQLEGSLSTRVGRLREAVLKARAHCEVVLDFPDEDLPELTGKEIAQQLASVRVEMESLLQSFERGRLRYQGARVAMIGRPNVGKSSLLNAMAGRERALVTPIAGTTRDIVEATIAIRGAPVVLMDTAGIRHADDTVEALGVERSRRAVADAECIVAVFDRSSSIEDEDGLVAEMARGKPTVAVLNKADLAREISCDDLKALADLAFTVEVSALTGAGLGELSGRIGDLLLGLAESVPDDEAVIFRTRHRDAARRASADVSRAEEALANGSPLEIVASDLAAAASALAEITGEITSEDVLDKVFADFCLGK
jgi:tRNA modification GTPase